MVGMPLNSAKSSTSFCAKVRITAPWSMRPITRAVSLIGSPRPSWMSAAARNIGSPPSSRIPTSKETRVRVEDFEKIKAQHWWRSGCEAWWPREDFIAAVSASTARISSRERDSMERRFFIVRLGGTEDSGDGGNAFQNGGEFLNRLVDLPGIDIQWGQETNDSLA